MVGKARAEGRGRDEREKALWGKRERRVAEVTERDGDVLIW